MDVAKYAALFLAESREHLGRCNDLLLDWERDPSAAASVAGLFRAVHTIKGMAATMGYGGVAELAHRFENLLDALRAGHVTPAGATFETLFRATDALGALVEGAATGDDAEPAPELLAALDAAARSGGGERKARASAAIARIRSVQVAIRSDAPLRGARAALVVRKLEELGPIAAMHPPAALLEHETFDGHLCFRVQTSAVDEAIAAAVMAAGEVRSVRFDESDALSAAAARAAAPVRQVRVDLPRLDALMRQVGELLVARNRLTTLAAELEDTALAETSARIARLAGEIQDEVVAARMAPLGEVLERFPRLVRDLARDLGKQIRCELEGDEIGLDRSVLDEIGEPLLHLVRNAADHGIELPAARAAAGKPAEGRIAISVTGDRDVVTIRVRDDGRGIDRRAIAAKARRDGVEGIGSDALDDATLMRVLARPGFSTAEQVSDVSGRGVGVDAAMTRIRALGGTLEVRSEQGRGTTFVVRVPLTLAIVPTLLAQVGDERYAVPVAYVAETVQVDERAVTTVDGRDALVLRGAPVPVVRLGAVVGVAAEARPRRPAVVLEVGERRAALVVDALVGQQDIVVKPFEAPRGMSRAVGGATILADGAPALILDAAAIL